MNGKLEKMIKADEKMIKKLEAQPPILREFYYDMKDEDKSYTTITNYINHVIHFMNFITGDRYKKEFYKNVTSSDIKRYMNSIKRKNVNGEVIEIGDEIRAARWSSLNAFFNFLKENKYIEENPMEMTKRPKSKVEHVVTYLTEEEINALLDNVRNEAQPMFVNRDLCIISIGVTTGLRVSAICNINISDIDFNMNRIKVVEKGNKTRYIRFGEKTKDQIKNCIADRKKYFNNVDTEALFVSRNGNRLSTSMVGVLIGKYTGGITEKHITPHKLRASCATNLYQKTGDLLLTSKILGHENIQTTRRYAAVADDSLDKATQILDDLV